MATVLDRFGRPMPKTEAEANAETNSTTTAVVDAETNLKTEEETENKTNDKSDELYVPTPIFLLFAEFLGFPSMFLEMAENWCNPKKPFPSKNIKTLLEREARTIYDDMLSTYTEDEIHAYYLKFYVCGLDEMETDLNEKIELNSENLPF